MMKFIVRSKSRKCAGPNTVCEEYLSGPVNPRSRIFQFLPSGRDVIKQTILGSLQGHSSCQKNEKNDVRKQSWKPDDLTALMKPSSDDEVNQEPADGQAAQKFPLHSPNLLDTMAHSQNSSSALVNTKKFVNYEKWINK